MTSSARLLAGLLLWATASFSGAMAADPTRCNAGPPAPDAATPRVLTGDFDGDGVADRMWILPPAKAAEVPRAAGQGAREWARDPWNDRQRPFDPAVLALVVAPGGGTSSATCSLIQNRRFFATPIWEEGDRPVRVLLRTDPAARAWRQVARHWRGDGVLLGTEAGVDVLLYSDGRRFRIAVAREAP